MDFWLEYALKQQKEASRASSAAYGDAQEAIKAAQQRLSGSEKSRQKIQNLLGSDAQVFGDYAGQYGFQTSQTTRVRNPEYDPNYTGTRNRGKSTEFFTRSSGHPQGKANAEQYANVISQANTFQAQALEAARGGDTAAADDLAMQAKALLAASGLSVGSGGLQLSGGGTGDPTLDSPEGKLAGSLIYDARGLMDQSSHTSQSFLSNLIDPATEMIDQGEINAIRAVTAGERGAVRAQRDLSMATGGARNVAGEAAQRRRFEGQFALDRATVHTGAAEARAEIKAKAYAAYEEYRRAWAGTALDIAERWTDSRAFIRDEYNALQNELTGMLVGVAGQRMTTQAGLSAALTGEAIKRANQLDVIKAQKKSGNQDLIVGIVGSIAGVVAGAFTGGAGAVAVGGLMSAYNATGGFGTSGGGGAPTGYDRPTSPGLF